MGVTDTFARHEPEQATKLETLWQRVEAPDPPNGRKPGGESIPWSSRR